VGIFKGIGGIMEPIKIKEGAYVNLLEYEGRYRLEQGNVGDGGKWWADRVIPLKWDTEQKKRVPSDKEGNVKIQLGGLSTAIVVALEMLRELTGSDWVEKCEKSTTGNFGPLNGESDAPF
jgi:hypothetical protein